MTRKSPVGRARRALGGTLGGFGCLLCGLLGLAAIVVNLIVIFEATGWGFWAVVLGLFLFPLLIVAAPWYALIAWGNPIPLAITYGGFGVLLITSLVAGLIAGEEA